MRTDTKTGFVYFVSPSGLQVNVVGFNKASDGHVQFFIAPDIPAKSPVAEPTLRAIVEEANANVQAEERKAWR